MYLKSLEIFGFKSFAKKSELLFTSPITAIVGPNGSGKSNVAEAFRFVLGEQSIKSLRGKKGEDLIFNGSAKVGKLNRAGVKVVFDNSRRSMPIDFDEVTIERVVHRDGVNEYFINGTQVRLRDIAELLVSAHIGASGHHIISQGEADRILSANPKERREMVEDALGLKIYQYKRVESEKKLEKTRENIEKVASMRRELAPHLKFLRKQVEKFEKAQALKEELRTLYKEYLKREDLYLKHQKQFIELEKKAPLEELAILDAELVAARAAVTKAHEGTGRSHELLALEAKIKIEREKKDVLYRDMGRIEGELNGLQRSLRRYEEMLKAEDTKMIPLKEVQTIQQEIDVVLSESVATSDPTRLKELLRSIKDKVSAFISRHRTQTDTRERDNYLAEIEKLTGERSALQSLLDSHSSAQVELAQNYEELKRSIEKEKEGGLEAEKSILKIMARQSEVNGRLSSLRAFEEKLTLEKSDFDRELQEAGVMLGREVIHFEQYELPTGPITLESERAPQLDRRRTIEKMKIRLEEAGLGSGEDVLKEFQESEERDTFLAREVEDLEKSAASLEQLIAELKTKLDVEFEQGIIKINLQFNAFFQVMFGGGTATLQLVKEEKRKRRSSEDDEDGDLSSQLQAMEGEEEKEAPLGIDVQISLPQKKVKGLVMLSGGERALTSIALLFAISQVNPPPFIILDETDAALDEANSRRYGDMIENLAKYSQLILITHNRETMSRAGVLYGVTMGGDGVSKLLSIQFDEAVAVAK